MSGPASRRILSELTDIDLQQGIPLAVGAADHRGEYSMLCAQGVICW